MNRHRQPTRDGAGPAALISDGQQRVVAVFVAFGLVVLLAWWWHNGGHRGELIEIDKYAAPQIEYRVDVNQAQWPELAQLPGIGETLAQRIVESRTVDGPYLDLDELLRVRGIGPRTLQRIKPYLVPLAGQDAFADVR